MAKGWGLTSLAGRRFLVGALVWVASALYVAGFVTRGWVPHDEGMLGQTAERVLRGELPHADFDESYTGGLTQWHALLFRLLGVRLVALRFGLFALFLGLFVPAFYAIASRSLSPAGAALLTLLSIAWSFPNYFASLPSWYIVTFALAGAFCLLRELDTGRRIWMFAAGIFAGLALLVLIVGLYGIAAVLLYVAFREQTQAAARPRSSGGAGFFLFEAACLAGFLGLLLAVVGPRAAPMEVLQLVVPAAAIAAVVLVGAWRTRGRGSFGARLRALSAQAAPFLGGVLLPMGLFLVPYWRRAALGDLFRGLFVLPFRQIAAASTPFPPLASAAFTLPYGLAIVVSLRGWRPSRPVLAVLALGLGAFLLATGSEEAYRGVWHSVRSLAVIAAVIGAGALLTAEPSTERRRAEVFLLLALMALLALLQFPYAAPVYFCFVAPWIALAIAAELRGKPLALHGVVAAFYLLFALCRLNPGYIWDMGVRWTPYAPLAMLEVPRAGLRVPVADRDTYTALVEAIERHVPGDFLFAEPDCPEVAFLSRRLNPTRTVFAYLREPESPDATVSVLAGHGVAGVVINEHPSYSPPLSPSLQAALAARYPESAPFGSFLLRWRP
jgi:hypothetical protein